MKLGNDPRVNENMSLKTRAALPLRELLKELHDVSLNLRAQSYEIEGALFGPQPAETEVDEPINCVEDALRDMLRKLREANNTLSSVRERL